MLSVRERRPWCGWAGLGARGAIRCRMGGTQLLEARLSEEARRLKARAPQLKVLVSAEIDATCPLWSSSAAAMKDADLSRRVFMHRPDGSVWLGKPWMGTFMSPWYNWSSTAAVEWWINKGPIAGAMLDPNIDGVYLDELTPIPASTVRTLLTTQLWPPSRTISAKHWLRRFDLATATAAKVVTG